MTNEIELRFQNELANTPDPITFALTFPKRMEQALELAKTPEDANGLRSLAAMGATYLKHMLPGVVRDRHERYVLMYPTEAAYVDASAKVGELWKTVENKQPSGVHRRTNSATLTFNDAGFRSRAEATSCVRVGSLDPQDLDIYKNKCIQDEDHITINGAEKVWILLNPNIATPREPTDPMDILLYAGDMLDVVPTLGKFELVVTDPPYGVTDYAWDVLHTEEWLKVITPHLAQEYNLFWFCSPTYAADIEMIFRDLGLPIQSRIVWHRRNMAMGSKALNKFVDSWEMCLHVGNRELNFPAEWSDAWFDVQIFAVPQTNFTDQKYHPTQKPEALIQRLIEFGSFPGDHILDPFAGSGTTGAVCPDDRECTLIEKEEDYIQIIEKRLGVNHVMG